MKERVITAQSMCQFEHFLREDEKSPATIQKYMHDVQNFAAHMQGEPVIKTRVLEYKSMLSEEYAISSANSMLSAVNKYLQYEGWCDCCVKLFKIQKSAYCSQQDELSKGEYMRLLEAAQQNGNRRLFLLIQTICCTGIRVSEVEFITVEALRCGEAEVSCKGKIRKILIVPGLCDKLLDYAQEQGICGGPVFLTRNDRPMNRCNIWREMKKLCEQANVPEQKVYPHNLRHLFARTFYDMEKDIVKLADVMGHANINTTRLYIVSTGEEHRRKMEQMGLIV